MAPPFDFPGKQEIVKNNEEIMNGPDFWNDQKAAQRIIRETNALKSLMELYEFPLVMVMSHRGTEGESIVGQVPMGESTPRILEAMDFKFFKPETPEAAYDAIRFSWELSEDEGKPVSVLLEISYW